MKRTYIVAASLLLGTSALAWAPSVAQDVKDPMAVEIVKPTVAEVVAAKQDAAKSEVAAWSDEEAAIQPAALQTWSDQPKPAETDLDLAEDPDTQTDPEVPAEPDPIAVDTGMTDAGTGLGGPDTLDGAEPVTTAAATELTPRPAAHNYPPCDPGPGDDNCIQLYEPGVRMALASWNEPTGGLLDHQATTAMGGPYEPLTDEQIAAQSAATGEEAVAMGGPYEPVDGSSEVAMNGDGVVDPSLGETATLEGADSAAFTGVGGPTVETGYPPCSPGPGDDRCIQLYEPGVTGAGN